MVKNTCNKNPITKEEAEIIEETNYKDYMNWERGGDINTTEGHEGFPSGSWIREWKEKKES